MTVVKVLGGYLEVESGGIGGGQPPGIWGGGNEGFPTHPIAPGGRPPFPSQGPGFPTHPIAPGGQPPGFWGGINPHPDQGLPGQPPGIWGGRPPWLDNTLPGGGGGQPGGNPHPEHPIPPTIWIGPVLPEGAEEPQPEDIEWHSAWSSETGWVTVGIPTGEVPTPSEGQQPPPPPKK